MLIHDSISGREARARACEEVLHSRTFARSEQLVQFLRYICDLELDGRGAEINEYSIATCALHRRADYSPGEDSSVRSRAHALRRKLAEYYETEHPEAELRTQPGAKPVSTVDGAAPQWVGPWYERLNVENRGGPLYVAGSMGYSLAIDGFAAMTVSGLLGAAGSSHHALPGSSAQASAIHETGLVIIGAPAYTTCLARILQATPYSIWFDPARNDEVLGRKGAGQGLVYAPKRNPVTNRYSTVYGLVTVLPSQPGRTRPERTLIFAGFSGSPGAQAGVSYFTSPEALRDLERRFQQQGYQTFPPAYQVVVRCGVDAEMAINTAYETHLVLPKVPLIE